MTTGVATRTLGLLLAVLTFSVCAPEAVHAATPATVVLLAAEDVPPASPCGAVRLDDRGLSTRDALAVVEAQPAMPGAPARSSTRVIALAPEAPHDWLLGALACRAPPLS